MEPDLANPPVRVCRRTRDKSRLRPDGIGKTYHATWEFFETPTVGPDCNRY